jgi:hypothetical protein
MPKWIHGRAEHLLAKNPSMEKGTAFAIATQQSHALGKSPKGYGTSEGRSEAKAKYDTPKDDKKTANPGSLDTPKLASDAAELAGLGILALPSLDNLQARARAHFAKDKAPHAVERRQFLGEPAHDIMEVGGLGVLAAPYAKKMLLKHGMPNLSALGGLASKAVRDPRMMGAAIGSGGGALLGAAHAPPGHKMRGALVGGLGGAAVGGAIGSMAPAAAAGAAPKMPATRAAIRTTLPAGAVPSAPLTSRVLPNPTQVVSSHISERFGRLSPDLQQGLASSIPPEMARMGMTPQAAMQLAMMGRKGGENASQAIARHVRQVGVPQQAGAGFRAAASDAMTKAAFEVSQYSGTLGPTVGGPYASYIPPFRVPSLKTAGPPSEELAHVQRKQRQDTRWSSLESATKTAMIDELSKLNAVTAVKSPESALEQSQSVGAPKVTAPPGPSIQQVAKPVGFGRPMAGATKSGAI